ncbi:hypothetical protein HOU03_gp264 [Caulobacter phage CcrSC]|uniref:Uncharacterized protein n=1 Tax=Caulobacter phage CcrSC TaxID=2283272 RepID=A0A385EDP1_9CAUD|nr:hypothetical protein HOU03_gp264 [Caulobacter phage CcrSC]AXQ70004.1 hypothetical protein CcrSC_gp422 [Caulobacter phage CcrSC]
MPDQKLLSLLNELECLETPSTALDLELWGLLCAKPESPDPRKVGVKPPAFTGRFEDACWLACYLIKPEDHRLRAAVIEEAVITATHRLAEDDSKCQGKFFLERAAVHVCENAIKALIDPEAFRAFAYRRKRDRAHTELMVD